MAKSTTKTKVSPKKSVPTTADLEAESLVTVGSVTKQLVRRGNSYALVVDRNLMSLMGIDPDTPLRLTVTGGALRVERADTGIGAKALAESYKKLRKNKAFNLAMKRLAR